MAMTKAQAEVALKQMGADSAENTKLTRIVAAIHGMDKEGKSHQGLSAEGPIVVYNFDVGLEGVVGKFTDKKVVRPLKFTVPEEEADAKKEWARFTKSWEDILLKMPISAVKTVVVDTETELWELMRIARFGKRDAMPYMYAPVNAEYKRYVKDMVYRAVDKNVIFLRKMKVKYVNNVATDEWIPAGFGDIRHIVQINMQAWREADGGDFHLHIRNNRLDPDLAGEDFSGEMASWAQVAAISTGTSPEDWE